MPVVYANTTYNVWTQTITTTTTATNWVSYPSTCNSTSTTVGTWYVTPDDTQYVEAVAEYHRNVELWAQTQFIRHESINVRSLKETRRARRRATVLLGRHLDTTQRAQLREFGCFYVTGESGQRYRIRKGRVGNVDVLDGNNRVRHRLCCHPCDYTPDEDLMLAQALHLSANEAHFLATANVHRVLRPDEQQTPQRAA